MLIKYFTLLLLFIVPFQACTNMSKMADNQKTTGHYRLYTYPDKPIITPIDEERYSRFAVIGTNDLAGNLYPSQLKVPNRFQENRVLNIGGVTALKTYKNILKKHYKDKLLFVDTGSFLHEKNDHDYTQFLRNYLAYDVGALSLKEFQIIPSTSLSFQHYLGRLTSQSKFPLISSNIFDLRQAQQKTWPGVQTRTMANVGDIKVGFVSIIAPKSSTKIPDRQINGLYFQNAAKKIIEESTNLRRKGAQVLILLANGEIDCTSMLSHQKKISEDKVNFYPFKSYHCDSKTNSFYNILKQIPPRTIDIIFSGGNRSKVANYILGHPVLQNKGEGKYLSWVEVVYDHKHKSLDQKQTKIYQPVHLCHQFFEDSQDCYTGEDHTGKDLIPATFLGEKVVIKKLPKSD